MKILNNIKNKYILILLASIVFVGCERELSDNVVVATLPTTAEIFTDSPVGMGSNFYFPYGPDATNPVGSKPTAWSVDESEAYEGTASMRFDVPNSNDPEGNFAGALFLIDGSGRDLSNYDALTFWARASQGAEIAEIGFGENTYTAKLTNLSIGTQWAKYIIPIPDASKLTNERGMLFYSAGAINGFGYTFWIDELKFEKLGTIGQIRPFIQNGNNDNGVAFVGEKLSITNIGVISNLANGNDVSVTASPEYFDFTSSDPAVASVSGTEVTLDNAGTTTITASLKGIDANGSLQVTSTDLAPTPTLSQANVISIFSDAYTNNPVDYFNGYWTFSTTQGQDDININGNNIIKYTELNFVGMEFQGAKTIDASSMTHFHMDIYVDKDVITAQDFLDIKLQDLGSDNTFGGANSDGTYRLNLTSGIKLEARNWISFEVPFSAFPTLRTRSNLAQIVLVSDGTNPANPSMVTDVFVDNIYFHN